MNLIKVYVLSCVLTEIVKATSTKIFYVVPDNSSNISCPANHCTTVSQYFMDNSTLPVGINVKYHLLPGEHYITTMAVLTNLQNFSLVGIINKELQLPSIIFVSTRFIIFNSYNVTITNVAFKTKYPSNQNFQLIICISCTIENVTLTGCSLSCKNLIGRSYLNNIVINLTKSPYTEEGVENCYDDQGITLHYDDYLLFKENISESIYKQHITTVTMLNISAHHDYNKCYTNTLGIISVEIIEYYLTEDNFKVLISNSQFDYYMIQTILYMYIEDNSDTPAKCIIWITNCIFKNAINDNSVILVILPLFTMKLIFFKCEFYNNTISGSVVTVRTAPVRVNFAAHRNVTCTSIIFKKCSFNNNLGTVLYLNNYNQFNKLNVSFIGPDLVLLDNYLKTQAVINIHNMAVHIYGPVNISNNLLQYSNIMEFYSCILLITGLITISKNTVVHVNANVFLLHNCIALFQGQINISENLVGSAMLFKTSDVTFDEKIIFISNKCTKIITIESDYPYIKVMQHANITFASNYYL